MCFRLSVSLCTLCLECLRFHVSGIHGARASRTSPRILYYKAVTLHFETRRVSQCFTRHVVGKSIPKTEHLKLQAFHVSIVQASLLNFDSQCQKYSYWLWVMAFELIPNSTHQPDLLR